MLDPVGVAILSAVGAGVVSSLGTVMALKVHIVYIRETIARHEAAMVRAHDRIDQIERSRKLKTLAYGNCKSV